MCYKPKNIYKYNKISCLNIHTSYYCVCLCVCTCTCEYLQECGDKVVTDYHHLTDQYGSNVEEFPATCGILAGCSFTLKSVLFCKTVSYHNYLLFLPGRQEGDGLYCISHVNM